MTPETLRERAGMPYAVSATIEMTGQNSDAIREFFDSIEKPEQILTVKLGETESHVIDDLVMLENGDGTVQVNFNYIKKL